MTVNDQLINVMIMAISGIFIGSIIDFIRTMLGEMSPKSFFRKFANGIELFVWALLGVCTFIILFFIKGGEWRLIDPLAQICGIFLYETFFQRVFRLLGRIVFILIIKPFFLFSRLIMTIIKSIFRLFFNIILIFLSPFIWIYNKLLKKPFRKLFTKTRKTIFKN